MTLTPEQLDEARAREALRLAFSNAEWTTLRNHERNAFIAAARLAREGWEPVDPAVLVVRRLLMAYQGLDALPDDCDHAMWFRRVLSELRTICAEKGWEL